jgi:hypothetical protein
MGGGGRVGCEGVISEGFREELKQEKEIFGLSFFFSTFYS